MCEELCNRYPNCCHFCDNRKKIIITEKGNPQKFLASNNSNKKICAIEIDGCIVKNREIADYILCVYNNQKLETIFVIELKGSDIHKALRQIKSLINTFNFRNIEIQARIILNKNRAKIPSGYDTHEKKFLKFIKQIHHKSNYERYRSESKNESI